MFLTSAFLSLLPLLSLDGAHMSLGKEIKYICVCRGGARPGSVLGGTRAGRGQ